MNNISKRHEDLKSVGLVVFGILLNLVCGKVVSLLNLPFYFDCIGTIAAAITGGFMPGVLVGFFTNILSGITDYTNLYYGVLNVLIALVTAYFSQQHYFKKFTWKMIIPVISFVLIGNTVRLNVFSKRFTIHTMQLVGATRGFIRSPFVWRSAFQGLFAALLAIGMLVGGLFILRNEFPQLFEVFRLDLLLIVFGIVIVTGVLICMVSTFIVVNRLVGYSRDELYAY